jgi:hypothetical protein
LKNNEEREKATRIATSANSMNSSIFQQSFFIDDDKTFTLENMRSYPLYQIPIKTFVFHEDCEGTVGTPSAQVLQTNDMGLAVYCFNCNTSTFANECWRPDPILYQENEIIDLGLNPNLEKRRYIPGKPSTFSRYLVFLGTYEFFIFYYVDTSYRYE